MTYPHRIRLRGPWECIPVAAADGSQLPAARRVTMPGRLCDHGLSGFRGRVRYVRTFGYPGRIDADEHIWLTGAGLDGAATIALNAAVLATAYAGPFAFEVTQVMKRHNRLEATIAADSAQGGLWGDVALEIRCSAYLENMHAQRHADGTIEITGLVKGVAAAPLEIYGIADRSHVHYQTIEPRPEGTPFRFLVPPRDSQVERVRVELINIATVWYAWEFAALPCETVS